jgi:hypothetical protein
MNGDLFKAITYLDPSYKNFEFVNDLNKRLTIKTEAKNFLHSYYQSKSQREMLRSSQTNSQSITETQFSTPLSALNCNNASSGSSGRDRLTTYQRSTEGCNPNTPVTTKSSKKQGTGLIKKLQDSRANRVAVEIGDLEKELSFYETEAEMFYANSDPNELVDPLLFYRHYEKNIPILSSIVKELYCLAPTSVPAESLFSVAGFIQNEERNRLNSKNLEKFTFIKLNSIVLENEY